MNKANIQFKKSKPATCHLCAHHRYCTLGAECVNENYRYFMDESENLGDL